jgi:uncharacterized protein VirK/YbjX
MLMKGARLVHPRRDPRTLVRRCRLIRRGLGRIGTIREWLTLDDNRLLAQTLHARPNVIGILEWPYINRHWSTDEKIAALTRHYQVLPSTPFRDIPVDGAGVVADLGLILPGLTLVMDRAPWFIREGELVLNLFHAQERIYALAFSLTRRGEQPGAVIGAVQGRDIDGAKDLYRTITKAAHGLRPRDLLLHCFQVMCASAGIGHILAISDEARHHRHPYFGEKAANFVGANYDEVWQDRAGVQAGHFFELPVQPKLKAADEIPPHKRSMYHKRFGMLKTIENAIRTNDLASAARPPSTLVGK